MILIPSHGILDSAFTAFYGLDGGDLTGEDTYLIVLRLRRGGTFA